MLGFAGLTGIYPSSVMAQKLDTGTDEKAEETNKSSDVDREAEAVEITDTKLEEGDFEVLQGDGTLTYNSDGSVTYGVTSYQKNKIVYDNMPTIKDGIFEADITADTDLKRFGFIYRVQDASAYTYVGTGDDNDQYFGEVFGPANKWTSMTSSLPLKANKAYNFVLNLSMIQQVYISMVKK